MISGTSPNPAVPGMAATTSGTSNPMPAPWRGSPNSKAAKKRPQGPILEIWDIAILPICRRADATLVDVEHATDKEFEQFVNCSGIPVIAGEIESWSFDDRCGVIHYALRRGIQPRLAGTLPNCLATYSELFVIEERLDRGSEEAGTADGAHGVAGAG